MPRAPKPPPSPIKPQTLIIDNGAYTLKAGFASPDDPPTTADARCSTIPNCIVRDSDRRVYVGPQLEQCTDFRELAFRRPVDKGFVVNWEAQRAVWCAAFFSAAGAGEGKGKGEKGGLSLLKCDPHETNLVLTEAPNCPQALQTNCDQVVFEEFEFASYVRCLGPSANAYNDIQALFADSKTPTTTTTVSAAECLLLIDSGYSHTTITPLIHGRPIHPALRHLSVGGKFLTNHLKEQLSIRSINLMDETYAVDEMKEAVSFVSADFKSDLEKAWKGGRRDRRAQDPSVVVDYVLPDYENTFKGVVRPHDPVAAKAALRAGTAAAAAAAPRETVVTLTNERFAGPEILFNPTDVGLQEAGLAEAVMQSVGAVPEGLRPALLANVVVVGGNARIPGFVERLRGELRQIAPTEYTVRVASPDDPIKYTWLGAARMASSPSLLKAAVVTRAEYEEHGAGWVARKFANGAVS